jgi:hypothetical protein
MDDALLAQASVDGSVDSARLEVGDAGDELDGALAGEEIVVGHAEMAIMARRPFLTSVSWRRA